MWNKTAAHLNISSLFELSSVFGTQERSLKDIRASGEVGPFEGFLYCPFCKHVATFLWGHILQQGCKNLFGAQFPTGTHKCWWPFHASASGMAESELPAPSRLNEWWFNQWGVGNITRVFVLSCEVNLAKCHPLPCFSDDGNWQKLSSSLHPLGVKNGEWTCSALHDMSLHAPNSFPPLSYANFCQSTFSACVQGCHKQWASVIQPPFQVCFHCPGLQVSAGGLHSQRHHQTEGYFGTHFIMPAVSVRSTFFSTAQWHKDGFEISRHPCMHFLFEHMRAHYSNISSHIRLCRPLGNTSAASSSQQGISVTGRTILNLLLSLCDFPISGRHLPFGARQSGIWEGKVLIWPKAQQRVSFDQWVSFGFWVQARPSIPIAYCCIAPRQPVFLIFVLLFWDAFSRMPQCHGCPSLIIVSYLLIYTSIK